ncbi:PEP-CTERM sorting domain-containing protein [Azohydromonas sp. G-1-1-14]|uniref:PEP-CTERM sorting domain-containing protein n=2 Tax=Azohydromonas caseinilytica TaxID=2728836 RepID=A0A848F8X0_9BURK|nr:PEP-CTERM sorting domain-containing protein [Azohydromonas caseinilytica]
MKLKSLYMAGLLACAATAGHAASFSMSLTPGTPLSFGRSNITETGFMDEISFTGLGKGMYAVNAALFSSVGLSFDKVMLGGKPFNVMSGGGLSTAFYSGQHGGDWTLKLTGSGNGAASYHGLVSVAAVPEPETYALMLGGLVAVGVAVRRRRQQP